MMSSDEIHAHAKPFATKLAVMIAEFSNEHQDSGTIMAGLVSSLVFQNILTSIAVEHHEPGSKDGIEFFNSMYHKALEDALVRWQKSDLKREFSRRNN